MATTVRDLDTRVDDLEKSFVDFKARMETIVMLAKWATAFAAATLVTVIVQSYSVAHSAGRLESDVAHQSSEINKLHEKVDAQNRDIGKLSEKVDRLDLKFDNLAKQNEQLLTELRKPKGP